MTSPWRRLGAGEAWMSRCTARTRVLLLASDCTASETVAVSVQLAGGMAYTSRRARWKRARRVVIPVAAALAAVSAFLAWGPVGVGPGPIGNGVSGVVFADPVSRTQPAMFLAPIDAGRSRADRTSTVSARWAGLSPCSAGRCRPNRESTCPGWARLPIPASAPRSRSRPQALLAAGWPRPS